MGINSSNPAHDPAIVPPQTMNNRPVLDQKPTVDKVGDGSTAHANAVHETFTCKDAPVENQRPLKVRVIGAGYSGVYLGIRIPQRLRNIDLKIYEKNEGVGGTWWENRYPGCACDIPSHSYQYTFAPNKSWSGFYAPSHEICAYIDGVAEKYGAKRFIHLGHRVTSATWNDTAKKWHLTVETNAGESFAEEVDVVVAARGNLNTISWPDILGFDTFKGKKMHSAAWDQDYDFKNKNIGVIGGGSSSIQIVPELQKVEGAKLSCFGGDPSDIEFSAERLAEFVKSDDEYLRFRKRIEDDGNLVHLSTLRGSEMQKEFVSMFSKITNDVLGSRPDLLESFSPSFGVGCRRLTPGPGYLEALSQPNVNFITQGIESINETGLKISGPEGRQIDVDVLVCATGFQTNYTPPFPVVGKQGVTLKDKFNPFPATYLTMAVDGFPNYFMMLGPNSAIGAGSLTCLLEAEGDYIVKCIRKLQKEDYVTMTPKASRVQDFADYIGEYFKKTVYMDDCKSWYKIGGGYGDKISALWPGSVMHALEALRAPRWEDFDFEEMHGNRFQWLGNGWSMCVMEEEEQGDPSWYVNPDIVDVPPEGKPERDPKYLARPFSY
ncbi:FAD/NAD(P)-binding domain superfamily [Fusarium oxysporum f. sp. vasinfectum]|nr:FAD/NAD(P)-binding domain superfamily [Fusarium oxysporum f. sp. vasinfectum]